MQAPLVVSFYTKNTPYAEKKDLLQESCKQFDIPCEITGVPNRGSWSKNCCYKPIFIREKLKEHKRPLIWTDIDSLFLQKPVFFDSCSKEFAIHSDSKAINKSKTPSGTLYLRPTESVFRLLDLWEEFCQKALKTENRVVDDICLQEVFSQYPNLVDWENLPKSYMFMCNFHFLLEKKYSYQKAREKIYQYPYPKGIDIHQAIILHYSAFCLYGRMVDHGISLQEALLQETQAYLAHKVSLQEIHSNLFSSFMEE